MELETVFSFCSSLALVSWILLFIFYKKSWVFVFLFSFVTMILAIFYTFFIVKGMGGESAGGFGSLAEVALLFQKDEALLAGWIHYLAFDLFVGMWEASDAAKRNISRWLLLPCLILTFMLGPIGLLLYFIIRGIASKNTLQNPYAA